MGWNLRARGGSKESDFSVAGTIAGSHSLNANLTLRAIQGLDAHETAGVARGSARSRTRASRSTGLTRGGRLSVDVDVEAPDWVCALDRRTILLARSSSVNSEAPFDIDSSADHHLLLCFSVISD